MKYSTKDWKNGKVVAHNDGNIHQLAELLGAHFNHEVRGKNYYWLDAKGTLITHDNSSELPIVIPVQKVSEFFEPFKVKSLTAIVAVGADGDEGIVAFQSGGVWTPMIAADEVRLKEMYPIATRICAIEGKTFRVLRFSAMEDITEETKKQFEPCT